MAADSGCVDESMIKSCYTCDYGVYIGYVEDYTFPVMKCKLGRTLLETIHRETWNTCSNWEILQVEESAEDKWQASTMKDKLLNRLKRR